MDMVDTNRSTAAKQEIEMRQEIEQASGAPNENIVQKHLNIALLNVF